MTTQIETGERLYKSADAHGGKRTRKQPASGRVLWWRSVRE